MIGEKISGCNLYNSAKNEERLIGITGEITLPTYELKTETMSGAGIAGEYDSATPGNFGAVDFEIPFRIMSEQAYEIAAGKIANLTLRYSYQSYDETAGEIVHKVNVPRL